MSAHPHSPQDRWWDPLAGPEEAAAAARAEAEAADPALALVECHFKGTPIMVPKAAVDEIERLQEENLSLRERLWGVMR